MRRRKLLGKARNTEEVVSEASQPDSGRLLWWPKSASNNTEGCRTDRGGAAKSTLDDGLGRGAPEDL